MDSLNEKVASFLNESSSSSNIRTGRNRAARPRALRRRRRGNAQGTRLAADDDIDLDNYEQLLALDENRVKVPLGVEFVSRLPIVKFSGQGSKKDSTDQDDSCPICMCDFEEGEELRVLPCFHKFHTNCIDNWLCNESKHCPICRVNLSL